MSLKWHTTLRTTWIWSPDMNVIQWKVHLFMAVKMVCVFCVVLLHVNFFNASRAGRCGHNLKHVFPLRPILLLSSYSRLCFDLQWLPPLANYCCPTQFADDRILLVVWLFKPELCPFNGSCSGFFHSSSSFFAALSAISSLGMGLIRILLILLILSIPIGSVLHRYCYRFCFITK